MDDEDEDEDEEVVGDGLSNPEEDAEDGVNDTDEVSGAITLFK